MTAMLDRRTLLSRALALPAGVWLSGLPGPAIAGGGGDGLTIYSPAPAQTSLHRLNLLLGEAAAGHPGLPPLDVPPLALPASVNSVADLPPAERAHHWPIVTTIDFAMARSGTGPAWHRYPRASGDLKFACLLYDTGFGIATWGEPLTGPEQLRGKRIAAPPRASAVRLMTEILLRDGWDMTDAVTLVPMSPAEVPAARAAGAIDGTSWGLVGPTPDGHRSMLPHDPADPLHYIAVDPAVVERVNARHSFTWRLTSLLDGAPPLLSFAQGLAVWDESDPAQIRAMLELIETHGKDLPGFARSAKEMADWPGLVSEHLHPAAAAFYRSRGIGI